MSLEDEQLTPEFFNFSQVFEMGLVRRSLPLNLLEHRLVVGEAIIVVFIDMLLVMLICISTMMKHNSV